MESRSNAIAAGLFVVALTLGLIGTALWLTSDSLDRVGYQVISQLPVTGLHAKAAVRLRGVDVGRVESIAFDMHDPRTIVVAISVDRGTPLTRGTYAQLAYQGVTGLSFVALDDDGSNLQALPADRHGNGHIDMRPSLLDQLGGSGQDLLRDAAQAVKRLNAALSDQNLMQLSAALHGAAQASGQIGELAHQLQPAAVALTSLEASTGKSLAQLDLLAGDLRGVSAEFARHLTALDQVGQGAQSLGASGRAVQGMLVGDTLPRLSSSLDEITRSAHSLDRLLQQIEQQPQSLLFGHAAASPGPGEPGFVAPAPRGR